MKKSSIDRAENKSRILLVDDNRHGMLARKMVLEEQGLLITTASSGEEAIEVFHKGKFDLLVTDYKMLKMTGVELIRQVREVQPGIFIILLSGFVDTLGFDEKSTGADIVLMKGKNEVTDLVRAVNRLLTRGLPRKPVRSQKPTLLGKSKSV